MSRVTTGVFPYRSRRRPGELGRFVRESSGETDPRDTKVSDNNVATDLRNCGRVVEGPVKVWEGEGWRT